MLLHLKVSQVSTFNWTLSLLQAKHHPHLNMILTSQSILSHFFFSSPSYSSTTLSVFSAPPSSAFWCKISFLLGRAPAKQIHAGDWIQAGDWMTLPTINRSDFHSHSLAGKYHTAFCGRHIQLFPPFLHLCIFSVWCCPL